ncbi:MAG: RNA polymerase factor sigma-54 [Terriglobales bacterium]
MVTLQHKLSLRVSQKQILTPSLVQMVSVLALNKLELRDMITAEMVANPVLEELESPVPTLDEVSRKEEDRDRPQTVEEKETAKSGESSDPFEEIDFGSYFRDYLDPGYRSPSTEEVTDRPSFENFLSNPTTLTDHLMWQLGALHLSEAVRDAAELIVGNLNEDGYLTASDEELLAVANGELLNLEPEARPVAEPAEEVVAQSTGESHAPTQEDAAGVAGESPASTQPEAAAAAPDVPPSPEPARVLKMPAAPPRFNAEDLAEALVVVRQLDPAGVGARDLRECLLAQLEYQRQALGQAVNGDAEVSQSLADAIAIVSDHLKAVEGKQYREIARAIGRPQEAVLKAMEYVRSLDPRPGRRYSANAAQLIEPEVAFVKQGDQYLIVMNDEDVPQLRLNNTYRRLLSRDGGDKDVRNYVKERYKSAIQLIKNIEQRRQTILRVCNCILERQRDFLDHGMSHLKPMMIKEVAEEIGVHPSTVSRAVANKYVHTAQGVLELRYFFSEGVQGPEGSSTSLLVLKQRVKKLIEGEDPARPYTDEQITRILQSQGIQVTRRTVAKYREDMRIPSTHQRRVKK